MINPKPSLTLYNESILLIPESNYIGICLCVCFCVSVCVLVNKRVGYAPYSQSETQNIPFAGTDIFYMWPLKSPRK